MKYDVTIAIPVYNAENFIEKSLDSALSQTFANIEILLLDDCSTDSSFNIIDKIKTENPKGSNINIHHNDKNMGVSKTRNVAIDIAQGEYIYFFDSDDFLSVDAIDKMYNAAKEIDADLVTASYRDIKGDEVIDNIEKNCTFTDEDTFASYVFNPNSHVSVGPWNKLIKVQLLRNKHLYFPDIRISEDIPFSYQLFCNVKNVACLSDITYNYVIHPGSICQYNKRSAIPIEEINCHIESRMMLKNILLKNKNRKFFLLMMSSVMGYCFSLVGVIVRKEKVIDGYVSNTKLKRLISYPVGINEMKKNHVIYKNNRIRYIISKMPLCVFKIIVLIRK